ncbi:MAG: response regulator, partial [Candidatus Eisenbacteria bacterium]|nr:response regulator [Candidatus Eisenbacteria bacterium]
MDAPTVLFVDDDLVVLNAMSRNFQRQPFRVRIAPSAFEALEILGDLTVDVVVVDEHMPGMRGTELLQQLRREHPEVIRILLTGDCDFETARRAINCGEVYRYLTKPCPPIDLLATLNQAINHKNVLDESRRLLQRLSDHQHELRVLEGRVRERIPVERDAQGAILAGDVTEDLAVLVRQME